MEDILDDIEITLETLQEKFEYKELIQCSLSYLNMVPDILNLTINEEKLQEFKTLIDPLVKSFGIEVMTVLLDFMTRSEFDLDSSTEEFDEEDDEILLEHVGDFLDEIENFVENGMQEFDDKFLTLTMDYFNVVPKNVNFGIGDEQRENYAILINPLFEKYGKSIYPHIMDILVEEDEEDNNSDPMEVDEAVELFAIEAEQKFGELSLVLVMDYYGLVPTDIDLGIDENLKKEFKIMLDPLIEKHGNVIQELLELLVEEDKEFEEAIEDFVNEASKKYGNKNILTFLLCYYNFLPEDMENGISKNIQEEFAKMLDPLEENYGEELFPEIADLIISTHSNE